MSNLEIEKDVKPEARKSKYPFAEMKVGDSLLDPDAETTATSRVRGAAYAWGKLNDATFSAQKVEGGVRIWRKT